MNYEFYIDVFFLVDFYLNLLSLFLTAACLQQKSHILRLGLAAAIGSFWNILVIIFPFLSSRAELVVTIMAIGGVMIGTAFGGSVSESIPHLLRAVGCLFLSAGLVNSCYSFSCQQFYLNDTEGLVFTGLMSVWLERLIRRCVFSRKKIGDDRYLVSLYYKGREKQFLALADSGNRLCVPETGKAVSLISYKDCIGFCEEVSRGFYIPYRAVGTEKGTLFAMQFEKMEIRKNGRVKVIVQPVVAIVKERLSVKGDFSMILPEAYVPEEE